MTPAARLVDAKGRPYFLWDDDMTLEAFRDRLRSNDPAVRAYFLGKLKTACQMTAILLLLYHGYLLGIDTDAVGTVLIYVAALLTLWSMGYYLRRAMPWILEKAGGPSP